MSAQGEKPVSYAPEATDVDLPTLLCSRPARADDTADKLKLGNGAAGVTKPVNAAEAARRRRPAPVALALEEILEDGAVVDDGGDSPRFLVKNTFIEAGRAISPSLGAFYKERTIHTCPSRSIGRISGAFAGDGRVSPAPAAPSAAAAAAAAPAPLPSPCCLTTPTGEHVWDFNAFDYLRLPGLGAEACYAEVPPHPMLSFPPPIPVDANFMDYAAALCHAEAVGLLPPPPEAVLPPMASAPGSTEEPPKTDGADSGARGRTVLSLSNVLDSEAFPTMGMDMGGFVPPIGADMPSAYDFQAPPLAFPPPPMPLDVSLGGGPAAPPLPPPRCPPEAASSSSLPPPPPAGPAPGTDSLPSIGSADHGTDGPVGAPLCKPCAFLHTKGCQNGFTCKFCHLCGPDEKKRRRKEKLEQRRVWKGKLGDESTP